MKLIITEKPSVARDIASVLGLKTRHEGFIEGKDCAITWAFGHLVTLLEPHEYNPGLKRWRLASLPFVPDAFKLKLVSNRGVEQQFEIIRSLLAQADDIVCATDAGREGELIFRYLLEFADFTEKPFRRLWLNSLTKDAILEAFRTLKDGHEYDDLYLAAKCRSESDWIVGLNATRAYTVAYGHSGGGKNVLWSVGRVQTPVLAMIVTRDDEIRHFIPQPFWECTTTYRNAVFKYTGERFESEEKAQQLVAKVTNQPFTITGISGSKKSEKPPQLYDLTSLQRDMNKLIGLSATDTLTAAQQLYEKKLITYPRTDSRYLNKDMKPQVATVLKELSSIRPEQIAVLDLTALPFTSRIMDDKKVTDHHAIIPTGLSGSLGGHERAVFDAVVTQFIAAFYPDCVKKLTTVDGESASVPFQAKGTQILKEGWTMLYPQKGLTANSDNQELPAFKKGESGSHTPAIREGKTKPPSHFTENSLLAAMESAGRMIDDEELREALKQRGIGTPATRAAIIETLINRHYIERDKKKLLATDMGQFLISIIMDRLLKSPEMTGEWEGQLKQIEQHAGDAPLFMKNIADYTGDLVRGTMKFRVDPSKWGHCPLCGHPVIAGQRGLGCSQWKKGCPFVLWREYKELILEDNQLRELLQRSILLTPVTLPKEGRRVLRLTHMGQILDIDCPSRDRQVTNRNT
ncbi:MAG: DNA topoisomerase III [Spartobacteria bacterium]|nr:DNA topoisomerase III [Spartobacteria bacterium]